VLRQRADAGNGQVGLELVDVAIAVGVDEIDDVVHSADVIAKIAGLPTLPTLPNP
jgi:hypothetical protein